MRRALLITGLLGTLVAASAIPALADDLEALLGAAAEADYSGRQIVVTFMDGDTALEIIDVEHAGSLMMVDNAGDESVIGSGKLSAGDGAGVAVSSWNASQMSGRYAVEEAAAVRRLNREATAITILEDEQVRMRMVFDDATGAPLVTEVYDGDAKLFRLTSMLEVDPIPGKLYGAHGHYSNEFAVLVPTDEHSLRGVAAGYTLADAYSGPDDSLQGFYSDGLFSFSLFVIDGAAESNRFDDSSRIEIDGRTYRRQVNPGEMWVTWRARGDTYVLVGDLPPDHLEAVLDELPKPGRRNIISRLWNGLFG